MEALGFQFVHIEGYARKADARGRSVDFVLAEAERRPDSCAHVAAPAPPELVFGLPLTDLRALHDARAEAARATIAGGKTRRIRQDQLTLLTVVASHPATVAEMQRNPALAGEVAAWEAQVVAWLREQWGDDLATVVRHVDEAHAHLHAYVLPSDVEMRARRLHPGVAAKENAKAATTAGGADAKAANAAGDVAYRAAMRAMQDGFWRTVGIPCGLARLGPARRRLTRAAWHAEKAAVGAAAEALRVADTARAEADAARQDAARVTGAAEEKQAAAMSLQVRAEEAAARAGEAIRTARERAAKAQAAADAAQAERAEAERQARAMAARGRRLLRQAQGEAGRVLGAARAEADRIRRGARGLGAWLGALWHGVLGMAPGAVARQAADAARAEERRLAIGRIAAADAEADRLRDRLRTTEEKLAATSGAAAALGAERNRLAREVSRLRPAAVPEAAAVPDAPSSRRKP
ncbi:hypothetical protein E0493_11210 [Roseomonas sp. M0104]|uniref:Mob protein n=1 Tax=Teichococcus coralli TaxID=2545983 RepID=A0A845B8G5_9PROT|nr:hypothetical protein [Pseudoroseomonas coralli]MXP63913.1 hypothetical protein [Pseudoroseomonas coralli]